MRLDLRERYANPVSVARWLHIPDVLMAPLAYASAGRDSVLDARWLPRRFFPNVPTNGTIARTLIAFNIKFP